MGPTKVIVVARHCADCCEGMLLATSNGEITITADHRIIILRGNKQQTIAAGNLVVGDKILGSNGEETLTNVHRLPLIDFDVFVIEFDPDIAIETFWIGDAFLTKG